MVEDEYIRALENQANELKSKNTQLNTALSATAFSNPGEKNLIEYQLETTELLSQLEHFLRGDVIKVDDQGNEIWGKQIDEDLILFNDYGVNCILSIINNYLNKNTMLSRYDDLRINEIMADFGEELSIFIYCNYEKMGMNTQHKKTRYGMVVLSIVHSIESAYRRALQGRTSEDINTSKIFTQSDMMGSGRPISPVKQKFHLFRPTTW